MYGGIVEETPSSAPVLCSFCLSDYKARKQNYGDMNVKIKQRSYQVVGVTKPFNMYEWEKVICRNPTGHCWGPSERIFQVKAKKDQLMLVHYKIGIRGSEECVNRVYVNLRRGPSRHYHVYTGIGMCSNMRSFFWPGLFSEGVRSQKKLHYYHVSMIPGDPLEEHLKDQPIACWDQSYKTPSRFYPMMLNFEFFEATPHKAHPKTLQDLTQDHRPSHLTFIDMYPGCSGLRVSQFRWMNNDILDKSSPLPLWVTPGSTNYINALLYEDWRPRWIDTNHLQPDNCFIPKHQDGFAGPVKSFWGRINDFNGYYS